MTSLDAPMPVGRKTKVRRVLVNQTSWRVIEPSAAGAFWIESIAWSPDGSRIATAESHGKVVIWDATSRKQMASVDADALGVERVAWSPDSQFLAIGEESGTVTVWSAKQNDVVSAFDAAKGGGITDLAWAPNGELIAATGVNDTTIRMWQWDSHELVAVLNGHSKGPICVAWSPTSQVIASGASDNTVRLWNPRTEALRQTIQSDHIHVYNLDWSPDGKRLAASCHNGQVRIWDGNDRWRCEVLEGHTESVAYAFFTCDGSLLVSKACDGTVRVWHLTGGICIEEHKPRGERSAFNESFVGCAVHRGTNRFAVAEQGDCVVRLWGLDLAAVPTAGPTGDIVRYSSAKVVLVGEANVGKTCLAMRLAEDRYPFGCEPETTHGMEVIQIAAKDLHPSAAAPEGQRRHIVLWDFGGQDVYQLVHQMFLHDTTLALVLIDPTRGRAAMDEARDWNNRLEKHLGKQWAVKILVGAKVDRNSKLIETRGIEALRRECGFAAYLDLSAKTGRNMTQLRKLIAESLDWDQMARTSRPEVFQYIRDDVERRRRRREIVLTLDAFKRAIRRSAPKLYEEAAVEAVSNQLATQGIIVRTKLTGGDEALVLELPVIERYAGSLIVAARNNPRGVPVLEERLLGSTKTIPLPGMTKTERLSAAKERMVLECIVELMIQHGICFRHGGLLVFPSLFPATDTADERLPHSVSLFYDFTGAIDSIYASLVARLMVSEEFGEGRLWSGRVEFDRPGDGICGIRQIKRTGGLAHVDLFFANETQTGRRDLFTRFVEEHLRHNGVEIREHQAIKCQCGKVIEEVDVQANIAAGERDVICPRCRTKTLISEGVVNIRERDPESDQKILALRKKIEEKTTEDAVRAKKAVARGDNPIQSRERIRILHLSDLHFEKDTSPAASLRWLLQDLRVNDADFPQIDEVEYLVLSGDVTHRGDDAGFDKARQFVLELLEELDLDVMRCVFVPGNHDIQRRDSCYKLRSSVSGLDARQYVVKADVYLVRDDADYPNRLKQFSDAFYHKITASEHYPLMPEQQGFSYLFRDTGVQFLALNTAWEIDQFFPSRASVHREALANALRTADDQVRDAIDHDEMKKNQPRLRIAVFHHAIHGPWSMQNLDFVSNLQTAGVKLCLHGDVHEMRREWIDHWDAERSLRVIGAGTFGSKRDEITEGSARSYNLLEVTSDLKHARVYVREQPRPDGAWQGWNEFRDPNGGRGKVPFFDVDLT